MDLRLLPPRYLEVPLPGFEELVPRELAPGPAQLRLLTDDVARPNYNAERVASWPRMTPDLLEVLECLLVGMKARQIAEHLSSIPGHPKRSVHSINHAVQRLLQSSGAQSARELVSLAKDPLEEPVETQVVADKRGLRAVG